LQRIIILVAVIVAVPVVLWTITAFVRSYVAPPKLPTFQPMVLLPQSDTAGANAQNTATPAPSTAFAQVHAPAAPAQFAATAATSDGRSALLDIRKPPSGTPPQSSAAAGPSTAPQVAAATPAQPTIAQPTITQPTVATLPVPARPMAAPAPAVQATPFGTVQNTAVTSDNGSAPSAADHSFASPNRTGAATGPMVAAQDQFNSSDAGIRDLPAAKPIAGRIPLPRRRPNVDLMLQASNTTPPGMTQTVAQNSVPLPRARPADAPEPAAHETTNDATFYDRGSVH
jgi:hypothetical protein